MGALGDDFAQRFNVSGALLEHLVPYLFMEVPSMAYCSGIM